MANFLTFDLGTTLYKVALFDDGGRLLALERVSPPFSNFEIAPDAFKQTLLNAVATLRGRVPELWHDIAAVSFSTQANSFLLLDADDHPLTNIISWMDPRAQQLIGEFKRISDRPDFRRTTGMPHFTMYLGMAKAMWLKRHEPELFNRARRFCYIGDYLTLWLTGLHRTEAGVAGLSGACDIQSLHWWKPGHPDVPQNWLPEIKRAGADLGALLPDAADALGLPRSCRFIIGSLDQYCGAVGTGTVSSGAVCETTGTVLAAVRCSDHFETSLGADVYQGPAFDPGWFFQMSFSSTSANLLQEYRSSLKDHPTFQSLTRQAESAPPGDPVITSFDRDWSSFRNVHPHHTPGQVVRGIMRCVTQALAQQVARLCGDQPPVEIRSAGGGARNDYWLQMKADMLQIPFVAMECEEPTSLGAAMLAARAMGLGSLPELSTRWIRTRARFMPR